MKMTFILAFSLMIGSLAHATSQEELEAQYTSLQRKAVDEYNVKLIKERRQAAFNALIYGRAYLAKDPKGVQAGAATEQDIQAGKLELNDLGRDTYELYTIRGKDVCRELGSADNGEIRNYYLTCYNENSLQTPAQGASLRFLGNDPNRVW